MLNLSAVQHPDICIMEFDKLVYFYHGHPLRLVINEYSHGNLVLSLDRDQFKQLDQKSAHYSIFLGFQFDQDLSAKKNLFQKKYM